MAQMLEDAVKQCLSRTGPWSGKTLRLALSGGLDSTVLLHLVAGLRPVFDFQLRVMHVHHGLQAGAEDWALKAERIALTLACPFECVRLNLQPPYPGGLEAAAREARYLALGSPHADAVLLAHHADDQAETALLQWLRGSGLLGLIGMGQNAQRAHHPLGLPILRPFLKVRRALIEAYADAHGLSWIEDPSNQDTRYDRNFLRSEILPRLEAHFKGAVTGILRSQAWLHESEALLAEYALEDLKALAPPMSNDPACLPGRVDQYAQLSSARRRSLWRYLITERGFRAPPGERLLEWERQVLAAAFDRAPELIWADGVLRRWRDHLWLERKVSALPWTAGQLLEDCLLSASGGGFRPLIGFEEGLPGELVLSAPLKTLRGLALRPVSGGAGLCPGPKQPTRLVRKRCQEAGIPPWRRPRLPGIWAQNQLVAVPGLGVDPAWAASGQTSGILLAWRDPALFGVSW